MCGRLSQHGPREIYEREFGAASSWMLPSLRTGPGYNVAPGTPLFAIGGRADGSRHGGHADWGFQRHGAKRAATSRAPINARAETIATNGLFRAALIHRRLIVPADGFYEWRSEPRGPKTPHFIRRRDGKPLALAAIFSRLASVARMTGAVTCAIVTCPPNEVLAPIHDRMPVILDHDALDVWLDPTVIDPERLQRLLVPSPARELEAYEVSRAVNDARNDYADLLRPVRDRARPG